MNFIFFNVFIIADHYSFIEGIIEADHPQKALQALSEKIHQSFSTQSLFKIYEACASSRKSGIASGTYD